MGVLSLQLCVAAFAQEEKREQSLGASPPSSPDRPNRGWDGKHRNGGRKTGASGRQGKPQARRGTPSALPAHAQRRGGIELHVYRPSSTRPSPYNQMDTSL